MFSDAIKGFVFLEYQVSINHQHPLYDLKGASSAKRKWEQVCSAFLSSKLGVEM